jgi:hypothetical protein
MRGLSTQSMRKGLTALLVAAQLCALALGALSTAPATSAARWRVASAPRGTNASQPREVRGRSVYAVAGQNWLWPRMSSPRSAALARRVARLAAVPLPSRPGWMPAIPPILRI